MPGKAGGEGEGGVTDDLNRSVGFQNPPVKQNSFFGLDRLQKNRTQAGNESCAARSWQVRRTFYR